MLWECPDYKDSRDILTNFCLLFLSYLNRRLVWILSYQWQCSLDKSKLRMG